MNTLGVPEAVISKRWPAYLAVCIELVCCCIYVCPSYSIQTDHFEESFGLQSNFYQSASVMTDHQRPTLKQTRSAG